MNIDPSLTWIVIPTYNRCHDLVECLHSVQTLQGGPFPLLIVDNASTDQTITEIQANFPNAKIIRLNENKGAAQATNIGFEYALQHGAKHILRLDSDTIVAPDFLIELLREAGKDPQVGILTGKIFYYDEPTKIWSLGAFQKKLDLGAIEFARGKQDGPQFDHPQNVDFAWATGMLLAKSVLEATGGFDPSFFVYYEEADLCYRAREHGFLIRSIPKAKMWHKIGQSSRNSWIASQWARSKMIYFRKHSHGLHKILLVGYAYFYAIIHAIKQTKQGGNRGPFISALKGLNQGLIHPLQ